MQLTNANSDRSKIYKHQDEEENKRIIGGTVNVEKGVGEAECIIIYTVAEYKEVYCRRTVNVFQTSNSFHALFGHALIYSLHQPPKQSQLLNGNLR